MGFLDMGLPVLDQKLCTESGYSSVEFETCSTIKYAFSVRVIKGVWCMEFRHHRGVHTLECLAASPQNAKT